MSSISLFARAALIATGMTLAHVPASAQESQADRADPSLVQEELRREEIQSAAPAETVIQLPPTQRESIHIDRPLVAGAILVQGAEALPQVAFGPVVERYVGRQLTVEDLRALASDIAGVAREAGYRLATAWIPPQQIDKGVLRVRIDEGRIDAVEVKGVAASAVEPRLALIATGKPLRTSLLERQLLIAGDLPGINVGKARLENRGGRNILVVTTSREPTEGRVALDNWGSATAGPVRARGSVGVNGVFSGGDSLRFDLTSTLFEPREFLLAAARYTAALDRDGTSLSIGGYVARSEAGGALADLDLDGRSAELEVELSHPLIRSRGGSLWVSATGVIRDSEQSFGPSLARDDRLSVMSASLLGVRRLESGRVRARTAIVTGLEAFGANEVGDPLSSRRDADGRFAKFEAWIELKRRLGHGFTLTVEAEGQIADGPLLSSEEMGLGGRRFGRAWDYREFSGDRGIAGSLELMREFRRPAPGIDDAEAYVFADAGALDNYRLGRNGGSLASAGAGLRLWLEHGLRATAEIGLPLTDGAEPRKPDPRASFTLEFRF